MNPEALSMMQAVCEAAGSEWSQSVPAGASLAGAPLACRCSAAVAVFGRGIPEAFTEAGVSHLFRVTIHDGVFAHVWGLHSPGNCHPGYFALLLWDGSAVIVRVLKFKPADQGGNDYAVVDLLTPAVPLCR